MMNGLSALPTSSATDQTQPADSTNSAGAANGVDATFLALLAALGGSATAEPAADGATWNAASAMSNENDTVAATSGAPSQIDIAAKGSAPSMHKHARKDAIDADALEHGMPLLPQPLPLPQPLQPQTALDGTASALFPDRVLGQPIMPPGTDSASGTGGVQPLGAYQPDSLEAPPGDVAPHPQGAINSAPPSVAPQEPCSPGAGETHQAAKAAFVIGGAGLSAGGVGQTSGRAMSHPYGPGMRNSNGAQLTATDAHITGAAPTDGASSLASFSPLASAPETDRNVRPMVMAPPLHPQMGRGSGGGAVPLTTTGAPAAAFTLAISDTAPFAASRDDRRMATVDGPANSVAVPGSPTARTLVAGGTPTANHPAIPVATARIVATAQALPRSATTELQLRLRPPDLGAVQVILRRGGNGDLTVQLIPATHAAADALGANLHHLRAALDAHSPGQRADVTLHQPTGERDGSRQSSGHQNAPAGDEDLAPAPSPNATPRAVPPTASARAPTRTGSNIDYTA